MKRRRTPKSIKFVYFLEGTLSSGECHLKAISRSDANALVDLYANGPARKPFPGSRTKEIPLGMSGDSRLGFGYASMCVSVMR